jgi:hypothetical protein
VSEFPVMKCLIFAISRIKAVIFPIWLFWKKDNCNCIKHDWKFTHSSDWFDFCGGVFLGNVSIFCFYDGCCIDIFADLFFLCPKIRLAMVLFGCIFKVIC